MSTIEQLLQAMRHLTIRIDHEETTIFTYRVQDSVRKRGTTNLLGTRQNSTHVTFVTSAHHGKVSRVAK